MQDVMSFTVRHPQVRVLWRLRLRLQTSRVMRNDGITNEAKMWRLWTRRRIQRKLKWEENLR
jgi:hypothetical protein